MFKTKIICTIGPSCSDIDILKKMIEEGMDIARLNFSHGNHKEHLNNIKMIKKLNKKYGYSVKILQDLEGYRIRIGKLEYNAPLILKKGQKYIFTNDILLFNNDNVIPLDYNNSYEKIYKNTNIFIDDGSIQFQVVNTYQKYFEAVVVIPGILKSHKGVNIPDLKLNFNILMDKDKNDILFGIENAVDFIAQSFIRNKNDIENIKDFIKKNNYSAQIISKIENQEGIDNIEEIIDVSDGIMIARGDMGASIPIYKVPIVQKRIISLCNSYKKFVITATQMLENMTEHIRPTRAEVSDVANAVLDGTNYVMLSAETAVGKYPVDTVRMMQNIITYTIQENKKQKLVNNKEK